MRQRALVGSMKAGFAAAWLGFAVACGGHSINLDQSSEPPTGAGGGGLGAVQQNELKDRINDFWVDDSRIYWSANGSFNAQSCVYGNCAATLVTYGQSWGPILPSGDNVFFSPVSARPASEVGSTLLRCPKLGCTGAPDVFLQDASEGFSQLASDDDFLYWSSSFETYRCPLENCGEIPELVTKSRGFHGPLNLFGPDMYWWGLSETATLESLDTRIYSVPKDGSRPPTALTSTGPSADSLIYDEPVLAVGPQGIYWLDPSSHIEHCPLVGCGDAPPDTLASTDTRKTSVWVDAANLYWLEIDGLSTYANLLTGTIRFCPLTGCIDGVTPKSLTSNTVRKFVLTTDYVYWNEPQILTDDAAGIDKVVYRMQKPSYAP